MYPERGYVPPAPPPPPPPPAPVQVGPPPRPVQLPPIEWSSPVRPARAAARPEPLTETLLGACLVYVAGIALVVAAFLPWVVSGKIEIDGWHATGDARFLLAVGIGALLVGTGVMGGIAGRGVRYLVFVASVVVGAVAVSDIVSAGRVRGGELVSTHAGAGPWLALSAGVVLLASIWLVRPAPIPEATRPETTDEPAAQWRQGTQPPSDVRPHPEPA